MTRHGNRGMLLGLTGLLLAVAALACCLPASAAVITVPGESRTIQAAIDLAAPGDSVLVSPGTYTGPGNKDLDFLGKDISLIGIGGAEQTVIDCEQSGRGMRFANGESHDALVQGFTIVNGLIDEGHGGAIWCEADVSFVDIIIKDCAAESDAGGMLIGNGGSPLLNGLTIEGCSSAEGGGMTIGNGSEAVLQDVVIRNNSAHYGGGVFAFSSTPIFSYVTFIGNEAGYLGGAVACSGGTIFENCEFIENHADDYGGAIRGGAITVESCSFYRNSTDGLGGAICLKWDFGTTVSNCSFVENNAGAGGAVYTGEPPSQGPVSLFSNCTFSRNESLWGAGSAVCADWGGLVTLENCAVAGNVNGYALWYDRSALIEISCSNVFGNTWANYGGDMADQTGIGGNISLDPLFCDADNDDFTVADLSPCLPANNDCGVLMGAHGEGCTLTGLPAEATPVQILLQNHPNPFNPWTEISFTLPEPSPVALSIHDAGGRRVRNLIVDEVLDAGSHAAIWRGRDDAGNALSSGVYFARLQTARGAHSHKLVLIR